jgi:hypothetical protein
MFFKTSSLLLATLILSSDAGSIQGLGPELVARRPQNNFATNNNKNNGNANAAASGGTACLKTNAIQTGSASNGQNPPVSGHGASATQVHKLSWFLLD